MAERIVHCRGDFIVDWFGYVKCYHDSWNDEKSSFYVDLNPIETRLVVLENKVATLEGINNGSVPSFDFNAIDPAVATQLFTAGFLLCVVPWAAFFGIAKLLEAIRQY